MQRLFWTSLAMALAAACAQTPPEVQVVNDAAEALGGRDRVLAVRTLSVEGEGTDGAVGGSATPDAPPNTFSVTEYRKTFDLANQRMSLQQVRTAQFAFANAVVTRQQQGLDRDIAFNVGANGAATRASEQVARARRLEMLQHPLTAVRAALDPAARIANLRTEDGQPHVDITTAGGDTVTLAVDAATSLPSHLSFPSYDANWGDTSIEAQFSEYEDVGGLQLPRRIVTRQDQWMTTDRTLTSQAVDGDAGDLAAPDAVRTAELPTPQPVNVTVEEVGRGIWWLAGGSHHSIVFEFDDHLTIFEVPLSEARTKAVIDRARALRPDKPLTHAIVSHHHLDHAGGFRTAVAEGLTIITHRGNEAFFEEIASRPHTRGQDALASNPRPVAFQLVDDELVLRDRTNEVHLYKSNGNIHSGLLLFAWVPRDRTVVQADFYDLNWLWHPWGDNFLENLKARSLNVARHVPVHGKIQRHPEVLAVLAEKPKGPE
ncbi:MAG: MBL fold metallo-hydrolase [Acidobacteria bacterium]|nr:MBL fold metallo-hydrolase [Acidobacteriota bacterium]